MVKMSIKTEAEIAIMTEGGKKLEEIREQTARAVRPGMTTAELDRVADELIEKADGKEARLVKEQNVFSFELGQARVRVDGKILVARPEDRIKKKFKRW